MNNFIYTRPSLKHTSAPQFQDTPSEVPIVYSRPSKNKCKATDAVHNTKDASFGCKNSPLYERPSKLHHRPQGVHNTDPVLKSILPKDDRSKKRKEELSTIRSILENQKKLLGHISSAMDRHTSPKQDTYNYRKQNLPKEQTHVPAVKTQLASNKVPFSAPPEVFIPPPVVPVTSFFTALTTDKASTDEENKTTTQELDNIGQSNKDPEIQDLSLTLEETSDRSERPLKTEHFACQGGLQTAAVEQHPQNQPISTDCPCNTEAVTEARYLAQLCLPAPNRLHMRIV